MLIAFMLGFYSVDSVIVNWGPFRIKGVMNDPRIDALMHRVLIISSSNDSVLLDSAEDWDMIYHLLDTILLVELDGDGVEELMVVMRSTGNKCCYESFIFDREGEKLYRVPLIDSEGYRPILEDLDGDGDMEIIFMESFIYADANHSYGDGDPEEVMYPYVVLDYSGDLKMWFCSYPMTRDYNITHLVSIDDSCMECCFTDGLRLLYAMEEEYAEKVFMDCMDSKEVLRGDYGRDPQSIWDNMVWIAEGSNYYICLRRMKYMMWYLRVFRLSGYDFRSGAVSCPAKE